MASAGFVTDASSYLFSSACPESPLRPCWCYSSGSAERHQQVKAIHLLLVKTPNNGYAGNTETPTKAKFDG
jgi:hypothetical protein